MDLMPQSYHHPALEIRLSPSEGSGLFAVKAIPCGELLVRTEGRIVHHKEIFALKKPFHPFQVEKEYLLAPMDEEHLDGIFLVNHSCNPNAGIQDRVALVALKDISPGEEICYDYVMTDSDQTGEVSFSMECRCQTESCRKTVTDLDWRKRDLQEKYAHHFSAYLKARIEANFSA